MNLDAFEKIVKNDYKIFVDTSSLMQEESVDVFLTKNPLSLFSCTIILLI